MVYLILLRGVPDVFSVRAFFCVSDRINAVFFSVALAARNISERRNRIFGFLFYIIRRSKNIFLIFSHNHLTGLDLNDIIVNCIIIA